MNVAAEFTAPPGAHWTWVSKQYAVTSSAGALIRLGATYRERPVIKGLGGGQRLS